MPSLFQASCADLSPLLGDGPAGYLRSTMLLAVAVAGIGGLTDLSTRRIPNRLTYPALLAGFALAFACGGDQPRMALAGFAFAGLPFLVGFVFGGVGGGDVKLMAALGALLGWPLVLNMMIASLVLAGVGIVLGWIWSGRIEGFIARAVLSGRFLGIGALREGVAALRDPLAPSRTIPFGAAAALGTSLAVFEPLLPRWLTGWT